MQKLKNIVIVSGAVFLSLVSTVSAQYDTDVIQPEYRDGGEVYGIDIAKSEKVSFFPEGCEAIDKVTIEAKGKIDGEIIVRALEENPKPEAEVIDNVFEYCEFELKDIDENDIEVTVVEIKVRKEWLEENGISAEDVNFFTFSEADQNWNREDTAANTESSIYRFYEADVNNIGYWAVGQDSEGLFSAFGNINPGVLLLCCIILLILLIIAALVLTRRGNEEDQS